MRRGIACVSGLLFLTGLLAAQPAALGSATLPAPTAAAAAQAEGAAARAESAPLPAPPASFADYPAAIAAFLNSGPAQEVRLKELLLKWGAINPAASIMAGEVSATGTTDLFAAIYQSVTDRGPNDKLAGILRLYQVAPNGQWRGEFVARPSSGAQPQGAAEPSVIDIQLHSVGDLTGDGRDELFWSSAEFGANTGTQHLQVLSLENGKWAGRFRKDQVWGEAHLNPGPYWNGPAIILTPGFTGSAGAGPQRKVTQYYRWEKDRFNIFRQELGSNRYMPQRFVDAEWQLLAGRKRDAGGLYAEVANDPSLQVWPENGGQLELKRFYRTLAAFRTMELLAAQGEKALVAQGRRVAHQGGDPALLPVIDAFADTYARSGDVKKSCQAARAKWPGPEQPSEPPYYWGFTNPPFTSAMLCPEYFGYSMAPGGTPELAEKTVFQ